MGGLDTVRLQRKEKERERDSEQLVTEPSRAGLFLLIGGLTEFAHFKVRISDMIYFVAAEDSAGDLYRKGFAHALSNFRLNLQATLF